MLYEVITPYVHPEKHPLVEYEKLHLWYKTDADQSRQDTLEIEERVTGFEGQRWQRPRGRVDGGEQLVIAVV